MNIETKDFILENLINFKKPLRYIGGELNSVIKEDVKLRIGLCYPDLYEVGMGNLALKILYDRINRIKEFSAERVFAPAHDFEEFLRKNNIGLYTLETFTELKDLDVLAITIPYELVYTNILNIIELGKIPLYSKDREYPLVIGGGPILNPEPLAYFFDGFFVGEADNAIIEILECIKDNKDKLDKYQLLKKLESIKGFYSPSLHDIKYSNNFFVEEFDFSIEKRIEKDINTLPVYYKFPIPWDTVHDKESIEISRGCYHRCRFCSSSIFYKPVREKNIDKIEESIKEYFFNNGSLEFSLLSLSSADYSRIDLLLDRLNENWSSNFVTFYLPSIKVNSFSLDLLDKLYSVKKTGLTLALECPDEDYRKAINKDVSDEKLFEIIKEAKKRGWQHIKIYLMIGFFDIIDEKNRIISFIERLGKERGIEFNISLNVFIPKPFTPFERKKLYKPYEVIDVLKEIKILSKKFKKIKLSYSDPYMSYIEGILARGSRETAKIIEAVFKKGSRFDGWDEFFNKDIWFDVLRDFDLSIFESDIDSNYKLPWHFINPLVSSDFINKEYIRSLSFQSSPSCNDGCNDYCGACDSQNKNLKAEPRVYNYSPQVFFKKGEWKKIVGIVFEKKGSLSYLSTIDILKFIEKVVVKTCLPLVFTSGFNPKVKLEFGYISSVGYQSEYENFRVFLGADVDENEVAKKIEDASSGIIKIVKTGSYYSKPESLQSMSKFFLFSANKFLLDKIDLLSFIKERYNFKEEEDKIIFFVPCNDFKNIKNYNIRGLKRIKVLDLNNQEVI